MSCKRPRTLQQGKDERKDCGFSTSREGCEKRGRRTRDGPLGRGQVFFARARACKSAVHALAVGAVRVFAAQAVLVTLAGLMTEGKTRHRERMFMSKRTTTHRNSVQRNITLCRALHSMDARQPRVPQRRQLWIQARRTSSGMLSKVGMPSCRAERLSVVDRTLSVLPATGKHTRGSAKYHSKS